MIWMCEDLFSKGKIVVMDSGFYFADEIVALMAKGLCAGALINKRQYWPKIVPEYLIDRHFSDKEVGGLYMLEASIEYGNT